MGKIAFLFPGQGSQAVGMGKDIYENSDIAKNIFDSANKLLNKDIKSLCFEGPEDDLKQTVNTQPCIVTNSIALSESFMQKTNIKPDYVAGHSLGEYCALYTTHVLDFETTIKAIQKRADLMNLVQGGSMAAILNAPDNSVAEVLKEASKYGYVDVANYNSPVQIVITGDGDAVKKAGELFLKKGARRVVPLAVSGAFHSKYMNSASESFKEYLKDISICDAVIPVITNVDAELTLKSEAFREKMSRQICSSVHWTQTIQKMIANGVDTFIEFGSGRVLSGLNKKIAPEYICYNVCDTDTLENVSKELQEKIVRI